MEGRVGVEDVAPDVTLSVEHLKASLGAVDRERDHNPRVELAGRNRPVSEGVLRKLVIADATGGEPNGDGGDKEAAEELGAERLRKETTILQR
jgi:hypothetical protein